MAEKFTHSDQDAETSNFPEELDHTLFVESLDSPQALSSQFAHKPHPTYVHARQCIIKSSGSKSSFTTLMTYTTASSIISIDKFIRHQITGLSCIASAFMLMTLFTALLPVKVGAQATGCEAALRDGVYNQLSLNNNQYSSMVMAWQLSQMTATEARKKIQGGLSIPVDGLPIDGSFTDESFNNWAQSVKQSLQVTQSSWQELSILQLSASTAILDSWEKCMANQRGVIASLQVLDKSTLLYKIRYVSDDDARPYVKIVTSLQIDGATPISKEEVDRLKKNNKLAGGSRTVTLKRTAEAKSVTVSLSTEANDGTRFAPAIVTVPSFPMKPESLDLTKWYFLQEISTRYFLNVYGGRFGQIQQPLCIAPNTPAHEWQFKAVGTGAYEIIARNGGTSVGRRCRCNALGDGIVQGAPADTTQVWELVSIGNGRYHIRAVGSDVYISKGLAGTQAGLHFALHQGTLAQAAVWELKPQGDIQH